MTNTNVPQWRDSYKGKLWSTAVEKCFKAPFVEVAIQYLLQKIDEKHQKELVTATQEERQRIVEIVLKNSEEQFVGNANSRLIADTDRIINLIHKE